VAETWTADRLYERHWALAVLEQVLGRLESEYRAAGNAVLFDRLKEFLRSANPDCEHKLRLPQNWHEQRCGEENRRFIGFASATVSCARGDRSHCRTTGDIEGEFFSTSFGVVLRG